MPTAEASRMFRGIIRASLDRRPTADSAKNTMPSSITTASAER
uniref:Uncharacterized protein n=1 Tax=Arundo donax TaxID=35708 RepID=A0A0A9C2A5_ARUDO